MPPQVYNIEAKLVFFATSHGKEPCNGIGGTVNDLFQMRAFSVLMIL